MLENRILDLRVNTGTQSDASSRLDGARISELLEQLQKSKLSRRGFIRSAVLLGLSVSAAEILVGCASPAPNVALTSPDIRRKAWIGIWARCTLPI